MNIQTLPISQIKPAEYNPRTITEDEFEGLKTSIKTFGQQENLIVNKDMTLISGHQRLNAMLALGIKEAVCNVVDLDKHQEKKLNVVMNSTAISGKYDDLKLSELLEELKLDDDYKSLRLDKLDPLDLSEQDISLPDSERGLQQMTFTLSASQIEVVSDAIQKAKPSIDGSEDNDNSNGNALYYIASAYVGS